MPGPSSSTCSSTRPSTSCTTHDHARGRELQRVLHEVGDDLRQPLRVERGRDRRTRLDIEGDPDVGRRGPERLDRVLHHRVGVDRRRVQRELVGVEAGEVEEVGDEALEPARFRRDHVGGADARVPTLDRAVGDRLGVPADRGERRAQVVRHAQQEGSLVAARHVEVVGHRVDGEGEAGELVVVHRRSCRPVR